LAALRHPPSAWFGVGLGLGLQAAVMLVLDLVAEARGNAYLRFVTAIQIPGA
jgi:hypothetical protein